MKLTEKIQKIADELQTLSPDEKIKATQKSREGLMWVGIVSILMFFGGLISAYMVRKGEGGSWNQIVLPYYFYYSTAAVLFSSVFFILAYRSVTLNESNNAKKYMALTLLFGLLFVFFQFKAYGYLVANGVYVKGNNPAASYLYIITFTHLLHLIAGILNLIYCLVKIMRNKYNPNTVHGLYVASIYWHFLGILWVVLFLFLNFFR